MALSLDRIDSAPIISQEELDPQFLQWIWVLIDTLNENLNDMERAINFLTAPNLTAIQINDLFTASALKNGIFLYDTTNNEYVGMQSGVLVKFTTTPYP
jgi:hypothetical protein